ncbi:MAG: fatty acid desaturase, partial [Pseudomonadota bacterium]
MTDSVACPARRSAPDKIDAQRLKDRNPGVVAPEWPTVLLIVLAYAVWLGATALAGAETGLVAGFFVAVLVALSTALHSSLSHEVAHGHPLPSRRWSEALVWPAIGLVVPYERFRDTHLAHHRDERLTDPHEDPESNFLDPAAWAALSAPVRCLLRANNTLAGRIVLGPALGMIRFVWSDLRAWPDPAIRRAWVQHALGAVPVVAWLVTFGTPFWVVALGTYGGLSLLRIRTFLEHRAHERAAGRSVIIDDCGHVAILFFINNLHALHHA